MTQAKRLLIRTRAPVLALLAGVLGAGAALPALAQGAMTNPAQSQSAIEVESVSLHPAAPPRERARMNQRVFDAVWNTVNREYYDSAFNGADWRGARARFRPQAMAAGNDAELYAVLDQMMALLRDDHASVSPPTRLLAEARSRQTRAVIGVSLRRENGVYRIDDVREDSPAWDAQLQAGWYIISADGAPFEPATPLSDNVPVSLALRDEAGEVFARTVTPRVMAPRPVFEAAWASPEVMRLRIDGFEPGLGAWVGTMVSALPPGTPLILDFRGNAGGRLNEAQNLISCFVPEGEVWLTRFHRRGRPQPMALAQGCGPVSGALPNPLVVLVDQNSRSASELVPAALQMMDRAMVIGVQTPGAVLASQDTRLPDGGRLTLSRADLRLADGTRLEGRGVIPDRVVQITPEDRAARRDPVLSAALEALVPEAGAR